MGTDILASITMQIYKKANLKPFHTFSIDVTCEVLVIVETTDELLSVYRNQEWAGLPKLVLGKGSNMLFTAHYGGVIIVNRVTGIAVSENDNDWLLHVGGGEDWPDLVKWCLDRGYYGLENLALIPGCAGSAPIQNIGAYGVELKDVCDYVDVLDLESLETSRLTNAECQFGYRDSVFKKELYGRSVILAIGLRLPKKWQPVVNYGSLKSISAEDLSPGAVFEEVCKVRMSKLPDPSRFGNAGSFFKNPLISQDQYEELRGSFPEIVAYPSGDKMKVAAGWLIDQCGLKGAAVGGAKVHDNQALVIINANNAKSSDVIELAGKIVRKVFERYQIVLEHEVRFMGPQNEVYLSQFCGELGK